MSSIIALAILVFIGATIFKGVRIVPQGYKWIVQRLGKYHTTLGPGLNFVIPYIDEVAYKVTTKDIVLDIPSQEVISKDNAVLIMNAVAYINLTAPEKAVYGIENYTWAIQNLVQTSLRSIVGEMDLDDALSSRDHIKAKLKAAISDDIADWGITLKTVEIQDIQPSGTMQSAIDFTCSDDEVIPAAIQLFHKHYRKKNEVRLLGVRLSNLKPNVRNANLFDDGEKKSKLYGAIDSVKNKFGVAAVQKARAVKK